MKITNLLILGILIIITSFTACSLNKKTFTDKRDGKKYKLIKIGNQTWMAQNLAFKVDSGCWAYNNEEDSVFKYGYLYNWETAINVCPDGWRLPTKHDFETLLNNKEEGETKYRSFISGSKSDFNITFPGARKLDSTFSLKNIREDFWSSSENKKAKKRAYNLYIYNQKKNVMIYNELKEHGFSVRCIKE